MYIGWEKVTRRSGSTVLMGRGCDWVPTIVERNGRGIVCQRMREHLGHRDFFVHWANSAHAPVHAPWYTKHAAVVNTVPASPTATTAAATLPLQETFNFGA